MRRAAGPEHVRGGDVQIAAVAEVQGAAVERADVRQQVLDMGEAFQPADQVGAGQLPQRGVGVDHQIAAHPGGQIDDDIGAGLLDPLDDLPVQARVAGGCAGLRLTDVDVHDSRGRPRPPRRRNGRSARE